LMVQYPARKWGQFSSAVKKYLKAIFFFKNI
jgi:hypothetical protein